MTRITNRTILAIGGMVLGAGCGAVWMRARSVESEDAGACGRYSPAQVAEIAARITRRIAPGVRLDLSEITFQGAPASAQPQYREWIVERRGDRGDRIMLTWNADTGRLVRISRLFASQSQTRWRLTARQAVHIAIRELGELPLCDAHAALQLMGVPERNGVAWVLRFRGGKQRITAYIDPASGELLYARTWI